MIDNVEDMLAPYLVQQVRARTEAVSMVLAAMTKREQLLIREIAVMAGVQARMSSGARTAPELDSLVVHNAILGCLYMPDLYPTFRRLHRIAKRRAKKARELP